MLPQKLAFVDIETTGGRLSSDRVIEIGIVKVEDGQITETFTSLVDPLCYIPAEIERLTGITKADLAGAPTFGQIKRDIFELLDDCVFVAHNVRFDYSFIKNEFKREALEFSPKHFCTVKLSRHLFPMYSHHNLDSLIERFGFVCKARHRAYDDAHVLWQFYEMLLKQFSEEQLHNALKSIMKKPSRPVAVTNDILDNLPQSPGVYIFYGAEGMPLYVGKSKNIRERVLSHFAQDHASSKEMQISQQIQSIEAVKTIGELGALLKESQLVKIMQPLYNRKLRRYKKLVCLLKKQTKEGYDTVSIEQVDAFTPQILHCVLGFFKSVKQAKDYLLYVSQEHNLCKRVLGIETITKECFGYRLGKCQGACVAKELPLKYNIRFLQAFAQTRLRQWPYEGPIALLEKDLLQGVMEIFIVYEWCCFGSFTLDLIDGDDQLLIERITQRYVSVITDFGFDTQLDIDVHLQPIPKSKHKQLSLSLEASKPSPTLPFDVDAYKILSAYVRKPSNQNTIYQLPKLIKDINKIDKTDWDGDHYPFEYIADHM